MKRRCRRPAIRLALHQAVKATTEYSPCPKSAVYCLQLPINRCTRVFLFRNARSQRYRAGRPSLLAKHDPPQPPGNRKNSRGSLPALLDLAAQPLAMLAGSCRVHFLAYQYTCNKRGR